MASSSVKTSLSGQKYIDFPYDAQIDSKGNMVILENYEAAQNALRLWLYSLRGERIRQPSYGGYVTRWLYKPLNESTRQNIQYAILVGLRDEFTPSITVTELNVTPDYETESWTIEVKATLNRTQEEIYVIENVRRIV